ncbi:MAG TPA: hypothetical protein VG452_08845 [Egibacteraceae bacterium]|nr:hypothetical protein [Actinomycetota bacterium]HWB72314.1 hypothetical protein [Egibacteraceae bacterium]
MIDHADAERGIGRRPVPDLPELSGGVDEGVGRLIRSLFERRNQADDAPIEVPLQAAGGAIDDAERFVDAVEAWPQQA